VCLANYYIIEGPESRPGWRWKATAMPLYVGRYLCKVSVPLKHHRSTEKHTDTQHATDGPCVLHCMYNRRPVHTGTGKREWIVVLGRTGIMGKPIHWCSPGRHAHRIYILFLFTAKE